jgi:hypothetical protein
VPTIFPSHRISPCSLNKSTAETSLPGSQGHGVADGKELKIRDLLSQHLYEYALGQVFKVFAGHGSPRILSELLSL